MLKSVKVKRHTFRDKHAIANQHQSLGTTTVRKNSGSIEELHSALENCIGSLNAQKHY